ncbi:MAG TPA: glycosyl hydrolase family 28 protein [Verrucomicrobiae bacterium]|nr:glycosyl hydrolase family 28 protein [Verrucomicrobiae bacterium]
MMTNIHKQDSRRYWNALFLIAIAFFTTKSMAIVPWTILINTNNVINVTSYGAIGDGVTTNTTAIQNAINAATAGGNVGGYSGGTVEIPAGTYLCGPLTMKNNVNLQIDEGAILRMLAYSNYPGGFVNPANFISGSSVTNIEISGPGAIDGQGAPWWKITSTNSSYNRPRMINFSGCNHLLIQNITLSNSPMFHLSLNHGNITVRDVTIWAPSSSDPVTPSHNTDACDVNGTNILVEHCNISVGDDDFTCSGGTWDVLLTNNVYGTGHGVSVGSYADGVSNIFVINCSFTGTDNGIRLKSERGRGGVVQNLTYCNLTMTNVAWPLLIYSYYEFGLGTLTGVNPTFAANVVATNYTAYTSTDPLWKNITFSNITAVATPAGRPPLMVWGLPEALASNIVFRSVNITSSSTLAPEVLNATDIQFIDCNFNLPSNVKDVQFFNAGVIFSNTPGTAAANNLWIFDGLTTNGYGNTLEFHNALGTLKNTNAFDNGPLTLESSTFTFSNNLTLSPTTVLNFSLGTNDATVNVKGNLALGGTNNITAGPGFGAGTYTLMAYSGSLTGGLPTLASKPGGFNYAFDTGTAGQVKLIVSSTAPPPAPTNVVATAGDSSVALTWSPVAEATTYSLKRSTVSGGGYSTIASNLTDTSYSDAQVTNGTTYYYIVSSVNTAGQSNSVEVSATPQASVIVIVTTNLFSDDFSASTLNSVSPSAPSPSGASYELISSKSWNPTPTLNANHLNFGISATKSGSIEAQALFATNPIALLNTNDSVSLTVTFTNTSGILTSNGFFAIGLYNAGTNNPVPGGLNGTATTSFTTFSNGYAQNWLGYFGQISFTNANSQIVMRPLQNAAGMSNNVQDVLTTGSGSSSFNYPSGTTIGSASASASLGLADGNPYTDVLTVTLTAANTLTITNVLYDGTDTNAAVLSRFGGIASGGTFLTNAFNALAVGWRETGNQATTIDINKISVNATISVAATQTNVVSQIPTNIVSQIVGNQLQLSWPSDHIGWRLQIQTNNLNTGLGTNWADVPNSTATNEISIPISNTNSSVFLRMVYP